MRFKLDTWMYVALILGLLQAAEFFYNRMGMKLVGELLALSAMAMGVVWLASLGYKLAFRRNAQ